MARRGVWVFVLVLLVAGLFVLFAALRLRNAAPPMSSSSVLVFDLPAELDEDVAQPRTAPFGFARWNRITVWDVVHGLDVAADDDRVSALVLHVDGVDWGWAKVAEVRDAIQRFRQSGKRVYASLAGAGDSEYYLASAADRIGATPTSVLYVDGLSISATFYRGTYDKLGIRPNFAAAGRFKSAVETQTKTGMSPDARVALDALLDDEFRLYTDSLATARGIRADSARALVDEGPYSATEARARGLVDTLITDADLDSLALSEAGARATTLSFARYVERLDTGGFGPRIALVVAAGSMDGGKSRFAPLEGRVMGSETIVEALRQARLRRSVKAVVLRIDSPGGAITAADDVWREVKRCARVKPVIASMSDLAASGGYYIAVGANRIVAEPSTITGSIGVFGGKLNVLGMLNKVGLNVETVSRGRHAEMFSAYRDFTPEEEALFRRRMDEDYRTFIGRVAEGRRMAPAMAESLGQGRVWSGVAARQRGLVDTLGGIRTAFAVALERAGYPADADFTVDRYPKFEHRFFERLFESWFNEDDDPSAAVERIPMLEYWLAAARVPAGTVQAMMPWSLEIR